MDVQLINQAILAYDKQLSQAIEERFQERDKSRKSEIERLSERLDLLDERIQGLAIYIGMQAAQQEWPDVDLSENSLKKAKKHAPELQHRPQSLSTAELALQAVMTIHSVQIIRNEIQNLNQTTDVSQE